MLAMPISRTSRPEGHPQPQVTHHHHVYGSYPPPPQPPHQYLGPGYHSQGYNNQVHGFHNQGHLNPSPGHRYGAPPPNAYPVPSPMPSPVPPQPEPLTLLFLNAGKHAQAVRASHRPEDLLLLTFPHKDELGLSTVEPTLKGRRGGTGELVAEWRTSSLSSKQRMTLFGREVRWKKEYDAITGLGHLVFEMNGEKGLTIEANGNLLARYSIKEDAKSGCSLSKLLLGSGSGGSAAQADPVQARLQVFAPGLSREQLEEVVFSCVCESRRVAKAKKDGRDAEIVSQVLQAAGGGASA
ncbi:hypothetical protein F5Y15DRAFT_255284 [Xylariaceae sp. FL0016]|nr:hypothetical protein F5Y15DRAFT_255284 [Xylariaceae sp. FL0016]